MRPAGSEAPPPAPDASTGGSWGAHACGGSVWGPVAEALLFGLRSQTASRLLRLREQGGDKVCLGREGGENPTTACVSPDQVELAPTPPSESCVRHHVVVEYEAQCWLVGSAGRAGGG